MNASSFDLLRWSFKGGTLQLRLAPLEPQGWNVPSPTCSVGAPGLERCKSDLLRWSFKAGAVQLRPAPLELQGWNVPSPTCSFGASRLERSKSDLLRWSLKDGTLQLRLAAEVARMRSACPRY